jgi:hypothetical protein
MTENIKLQKLEDKVLTPDDILLQMDEKTYKGVGAIIKNKYGKSLAEIALSGPAFTFEALNSSFVEYLAEIPTVMHSKDNKAPGVVDKELDGDAAHMGALENITGGLVSFLGQRFAEHKDARVIAVVKNGSLLDSIMKRPATIKPVAYVTEAPIVQE